MSIAQFRRLWTLEGALIHVDLDKDLVYDPARTDPFLTREAVRLIRGLRRVDGITSVSVVTRYEIALHIAPLFDIASVKAAIHGEIEKFYGCIIGMADVDTQTGGAA